MRKKRFQTEHIPSSSGGTSFEMIDLMAINDVPFTMSTSGAVNIICLLSHGFVL